MYANFIAIYYIGLLLLPFWPYLPDWPFPRAESGREDIVIVPNRKNLWWTCNSLLSLIKYSMYSVIKYWMPPYTYLYACPFFTILCFRVWKVEKYDNGSQISDAERYAFREFFIFYCSAYVPKILCPFVLIFRFRKR